MTFAASQDKVTVRIPVQDDSIAERVERFSVILLSLFASAVVPPESSLAFVEIVDNDCE